MLFWIFGNLVIDMTIFNFDELDLLVFDERGKKKKNCPSPKKKKKTKLRNIVKDAVTSN